jgi:multiple sugar transport system substrate-binding protein
MPPRLAAFALIAALACTQAGAGTLVVNLNSTEPASRAAWQSAIAQFERENAGVRVELNVYDHESYKRSIRNWLTGVPPDVVFWFAGNRMRQFVTPGLLEDLTDAYSSETRAQMHPSALDLVSVGGRAYGVPYTYYPIGLYVRRDVLAAAGTDVPSDWTDLVDACERLNKAGIEPFAIGTRDLWPAAAWFDYIDLRLNGLSFHMNLMQGRVRFTDPRVRDVFAKWRELVDRDCFSRNHVSMTWQEAQVLLYRGGAAMTLIGSFIVPNFPPEIRDRVDFVRFPTMRRDVGSFEEAPMNTVHVPARARNKEDAKRFVAFVMRADVQESINHAMLQIPVNLRAAPPSDRFLARGRDLLARADGLAQYFDRDTSEDLASIAMKGFQEFMLYPDRIDAILETIERARERIYGAVAAPAQ